MRQVQPSWSHTPVRLAAAALAAVVALPALPARAAPTTQPNGQPAALSTPTDVDTNSPKAAVKTYVSAEIKGDGKAIRDVLLAKTPTEQRMAGGIADLAVAIADLDRAMITKFGAAQTEPVMGDKDAVLSDVMAKLDKATQTVHGDTATVTSQPDPTPPGAAGATGATAGATGDDSGPSPQDTMTLMKVDGQWKVSVADMAKGSSDENVQKTLASVDAAVAGYRSVLSDLNAGKLASPDDVGKALKAKLMTPMGGGTPGTAPQTAPTGGK